MKDFIQILVASIIGAIIGGLVVNSVVGRKMGGLVFSGISSAGGGNK